MKGEIDVKGKNVCIMDDMISTGGTVIHAIKHLRGLGANKIIVATAHGIFAGEKIAEKIIKAGCAQIIITDSIQIQNEPNKIIKILKLPKIN
jgi:ribose-phosphate pyrophosphokinase